MQSFLYILQFSKYFLCKNHFPHLVFSISNCQKTKQAFQFGLWYEMSRNKKSINLTYVHHVSEFLIFLKKHKNYAFYVFVQLNDERNTFFMRLSQKSGVKVRFANFATRFSICASLGIYSLCLWVILEKPILS